jgi:hypothetical protein
LAMRLVWVDLATFQTRCGLHKGVVFALKHGISAA